MATEPGFRLRNRFYPYPTSRKTTDAALLEQVTGLTAQQWTQRYLDSFDLEEDDELVSAGVLAVAISRVHPTWARARIVEFMAGIDWDEVEPVGDKVEEDDFRPPAETATETGEPSTEPSSQASRPGLAAVSSESETQESSGPPPSDTSPAELSARAG